MGGEEAGTSDKGGGEEDNLEMEELMQDRDFLESVLSTLPGVNPEEALQNLEQMTQQPAQEKGKGDKDKVGTCGEQSSIHNVYKESA